MTERKSANSNNTDKNIFEVYNLRNYIWFTLFLVAIAFLILIVGSMLFKIISIILLILLAPTLLYLLTHKFAHLADKEYFVLRNENGRFERIIGDGSYMIRRWQEVDPNKPVAFQKPQTIDLHKITGIYSKYGLNVKTPILLEYYVDYSRISPNLQYRILDENDETAKHLNRISKTYLHRLIQSLALLMEQNQLASADAALATELLLKHHLFELPPHRGQTLREMLLPLWYITWRNQRKNKTDSLEARNQYGLVLIEFSGLLAPSDQIIGDREKALGAVSQALDITRLSEETGMSPQEILSTRMAIVRDSRTKIHLRGRDIFPQQKQSGNQDKEQTETENTEESSSQNEGDNVSTTGNEHPLSKLSEDAKTLLGIRQTEDSVAEQDILEDAAEESGAVAKILQQQEIPQTVTSSSKLVEIPLAIRDFLGDVLSGITAMLSNLRRASASEEEKEEQAIDWILIPIEEGDTLNTIASNYDCDIQDLLSLNNVKAGEELLAGQMFRVPDNEMARRLARLQAQSTTAASYLNNDQDEDQDDDDKGSQSKKRGAADYL